MAAMSGFQGGAGHPRAQFRQQRLGGTQIIRQRMRQSLQPVPQTIRGEGA